MKILVIKRDKIGDLLLTTPMLAHLRESRPDAEIHLLANDYNAWVVADNPDIDRRWIYRRVKSGRSISIPAALALVRQSLAMRRERFDVAIVANGSESARAIERGLASRAKRVIAYVKRPDEYSRLSDPLDEPRVMHESDRLLAMLAPLGIAMPSRALYPRYTLPVAEDARAKAWLAARGLSPGRYVVMGLGARRAKKKPTAEQVLRWAARFKNEHGLSLVFVWTPGASDSPLYPGDDDIAQPVLDAEVPYIHPWPGGILPALALIWNARTSIFPDSGLMHFAAASPGGVLGLFADTGVSPAPSQWGPRGIRASYLEAVKSIAELSDEEVFAKLDPYLLDA